MTRVLFRDREHAAKQLAQRIKPLITDQHPTVFVGLTRGGVPIAETISQQLHIPYTALVVKKITHPSSPEYGLGAISEHNTIYWDIDALKQTGYKPEQLGEQIKQLKIELQHQIAKFRRNQPLPNLSDYHIILVDDGLATGVTAKAAIKALRKHSPEQLTFATPVASSLSLTPLKKTTDHLVILATPSDFQAVSPYYADFPQVTDFQVLTTLNKPRPAWQNLPHTSPFSSDQLSDY